MYIGQPMTITQGNDSLAGTLDGFHKEPGGTVYEIYVKDDEDS